MMNKGICALLLLLTCLVPAFGQSAEEFQKRYNKAYEDFRGGDNTSAMNRFLPLTSENPQNRYVQFASYNYALAAFKSGKFEEAKAMLLQLLDKYPAWTKLDDAEYLLANTYFELKEYDKGITYKGKIGNEVLLREADKMEEYYINKFRDVNLLKKLYERQQQDGVVAKVLSERLSAQAVLTTDEKMLLDRINHKLGIGFAETVVIDEPSDNENPSGKTYRVALLLPLRVELQNDPKIARETQFVTDLVEGIWMGADSLRKNGTKLEVYTFDTKKDTIRFANMLNDKVFRKMDLIIGPIFNTASDKVIDFASSTRTVMVNPLSTSAKIIGKGDYNYLFRSTAETQAIKAAEYASANFPLKNVVIIYSKNPKDSLFALTYKSRYVELGGKVTLFKKVDNKSSFSLAKDLTQKVIDSTSHILVVNVDQMVASNLITALQVLNTKTPVMTTDDWLDFETVSYNQYQNHNFHFISPDFIDPNRSEVKRFQKKFYDQYHVNPSIYVHLGYDMMLFYGGLLKNEGRNLRRSLQQSEFSYGATLPGTEFRDGYDNRFVPIVKFSDYVLKVVNFPIVR